MRSLLIAISLLLLAAAIASRWPLPVTAQPPESLRWVRTLDGWEPSATLLPKTRREPTLHPFTVAAFQALVAGFALTAASNNKQKCGRTPLSAAGTRRVRPPGARSGARSARRVPAAR